MKSLFLEYENERQRLLEARTLSWSSGGCISSFNGLRVLPLTMRAWVDLRASQNGFICDAETRTESDAFAYIWRNCESYSVKRSIRSFCGKRAVEKALKKASKADITEFIENHIEEAFAEFPETAEKGGFSRSCTIPPVEGCCAAADELAARYGCLPSEIMDWPLIEVFQCQKASRMATIPEYKPLEPYRIRKISSAILEAQNNG